MDTARSAEGVDQLRVYLAGDGTARKVAVYHNDASRVPDAVKAAVEAKFPGATVRHYEHERYGADEHVHEVEISVGEGEEAEEIEMSVYEDGTLKYVETRVPLDKIPAAVKLAVEGKVPGGAIDEAELKEGPDLYQLQVRVKVEGSEAHHYLVFCRDEALLSHHLRYPGWIEVPAP